MVQTTKTCDTAQQIDACNTASMADETWLSWLEHGTAGETLNTWATQTTGRGTVPMDLRDQYQPMATRMVSHMLIRPIDHCGTIGWAICPNFLKMVLTGTMQAPEVSDDMAIACRTVHMVKMRDRPARLTHATWLEWTTHAAWLSQLKQDDEEDSN